MAAAWKILQTIHKKSAAKLNDYGQLAIATALTWDNEHNLEHRSSPAANAFHHAGQAAGRGRELRVLRRYGSGDAGANQFLPWEFLIYMVNHKTPREREWAARELCPEASHVWQVLLGCAIRSYDVEVGKPDLQVGRQGLFAAEHQAVRWRLRVQADFASRVGKSIGVPAEYVGGEAAGGELHAWVMWVEIKQVTRTSISFTLESHGRYNGDKYYVGTLRDPQTGKGTTDRELELRLQAVGLSPISFRHAKLVMQAFPQLREKLGWNVNQEIAFLNEVMELSPGNEAAWRQVALLAREGRIGADSSRQMTAMFDKMFRTFGSFPDFTWKVFDDLVQYQKNPKQRINKYYERLVQIMRRRDVPTWPVKLG